MPKIRILFTVFFLSQLLLGQSVHFPRPTYAPKTTTIYHKLGDRSIPMILSRYGESSDLALINLHDDEYTSVLAAKKFLETEGGILISLENGNKRNIRFRLMNKYYSFDPNRMFSREGIMKSLSDLGASHPAAIAQVERFAERLLRLIPEQPSCIIALHNNTDGNFSVSSYASGNNMSVNAKAVYINPDQDPDDLFLTTDPILYEQLAEKKYNVVLQDNRKANKDGSLSVYCGEKGIRYLNCETEHGRTAAYLEMITTAGSLLERTAEPVIFYNFSIESSQSIHLNANPDIYFGDKKIGRVRSLSSNQAGKYQGKLEVRKSFPLYSNMDFFISPGGNHRFELTIDPTGTRKKLNPLEHIIIFKVKD